MRHAFILSAAMVFLTFASTAQARTTVSEEDVTCLALTLYHEARGEGPEGMLAVGQVVMNRYRAGGYRNVCAVVNARQKGAPKTACQFSWACDGKSDRTQDKNAWQQSRVLSRLLVSNPRLPDLAQGTRHYVRCGIRAKWLAKMDMVSRIGDHCFYRVAEAEAAPSTEKVKPVGVFPKQRTPVHKPAGTSYSDEDEVLRAETVKFIPSSKDPSRSSVAIAPALFFSPAPAKDTMAPMQDIQPEIIASVEQGFWQKAISWVGQWFVDSDEGKFDGARGTGTA